MRLQILALMAALTMPAAADPGSCAIKGNISRKGVRIYHLPGTAAYAQTKIDEAKGEHWFCSEDEAKAAGWRGVRIKEAPERSEKVANPFRQ